MLALLYILFQLLSLYGIELKPKIIEIREHRSSVTPAALATSPPMSVVQDFLSCRPSGTVRPSAIGPSAIEVSS